MFHGYQPGRLCPVAMNSTSVLFYSNDPCRLHFLTKSIGFTKGAVKPLLFLAQTIRTSVYLTSVLESLPSNTLTHFFSIITPTQSDQYVTNADSCQSPNLFPVPYQSQSSQVNLSALEHEFILAHFPGGSNRDRDGIGTLSPFVGYLAVDG